MIEWPWPAPTDDEIAVARAALSSARLWLGSIDETHGPWPCGRVPFDPLLRDFIREWPKPNCTRETEFRVNVSETAEILGMGRKRFLVLRQRGIDLDLADQLAASRNLHPYDVWGEEWLTAVTRAAPEICTDPESTDDLFGPPTLFRVGSYSSETSP